jgi:hypothetical protein
MTKWAQLPCPFPEQKMWGRVVGRISQVIVCDGGEWTASHGKAGGRPTILPHVFKSREDAEKALNGKLQ